eukprot:5689471-Pyramimonas_sp.AAC.1
MSSASSDNSANHRGRKESEPRAALFLKLWLALRGAAAEGTCRSCFLASPQDFGATGSWTAQM